MKILSKKEAISRQWQVLKDQVCLDGESQSRLLGLSRQISRIQSEQVASAHAEIETAYFLAQAGFSIAFLEAHEGRTADLECYEGPHRFFVEVTVIQSTQGAARKTAEGRHGGHSWPDGQDEFFEQALVRRLLARMAEKARQLERYCAPVLLAVSVPDLPSGKGRLRPVPALDLQRFAAMLIGVLTEAPQFSAVLITLWNAPAQESRNPIRFHQVSWVTRPPGELGEPRVRLLAMNPSARYELTPREYHMIKEAM